MFVWGVEDFLKSLSEKDMGWGNIGHVGVPFKFDRFFLSEKFSMHNIPPATDSRIPCTKE